MRSLLVMLVAAACGRASTAPPPASTVIATSTQNHLTANHLTANHLTANHLTANHLTANHLTVDGLLGAQDVKDELTSTMPVVNPDGSTTTEGAIAREVLGFIYSCALPDGKSMDLTVDGTFYGTLTGSIGLAPEWETGACDDTCQRWITACLMARTNYYGITVPISIRGPHPALTASAAEMTEYSWREGTYYGNVFSDAPVMGACTGPGSTSAALSHRLCSGFAGLSAGDCGFSQPGSCLATFCENPMCTGVDAMGDPIDCKDSVSGTELHHEAITVYLKRSTPLCGNTFCEAGETNASCPSDCPGGFALRGISTLETSLGVAPTGDIFTVGRFKHATQLGGVPLTPAGITDSYLAKITPAGVVTWAHPLGCNAGVPVIVAAHPAGGAIVAGSLKSPFSCTIGGTTLTGTATGSNENIFLARYDTNGVPVWARLLGSSGNTHLLDAEIHVTPDGHIVLGSWSTGTIDLGDGPHVGTPQGLWLAGYAADGTFLWSTARDTAATIGDVGVGVDGANSVVFGGDPLGPSADGVFIEKRDAATGSLAWSHAFPGSGISDDPKYREVAVATDASGDITIAGKYWPPGSSNLDLGGGTLPSTNDPVFIARYTPAGAHVWSKRVGTYPRSFHVRALAMDEAGAAYLLGDNGDLGSGSVGADMGGGTLPGATFPLTGEAIAKFGPGGGHLWSRPLIAGQDEWNHAIGMGAGGGVVAVAGLYGNSAIVNGVLLDDDTDPAHVCSQNTFILGLSDPAGVEVCNGLDDDGDGMVDEGLGVGSPCDGVDANEWCADGVRACLGDGEAVTCNDMTGTASEICNGLDDDCDGEVDEGFPDLGDPCDGADDDPCRGGTMVCSPDGLGTVCSDPTPSPVPTCACTPGGTIDCTDDDPCTVDECDAVQQCVIFRPSGDPGCMGTPDAGGMEPDASPGTGGRGGGCGCRVTSRERAPIRAAIVIASIVLALAWVTRQRRA